MTEILAPKLQKHRVEEKVVIKSTWQAISARKVYKEYENAL